MNFENTHNTHEMRPNDAQTDAFTHDDLQKQDAQNRVTALIEDESFIIEAPAGAGKTELLTQRYLTLLATVNAPEEIIALTFTKKAAGEMAHRILTSLQAAHLQLPVDKPHQQVTRDLAKVALSRSQALDWQLLAQPSRLRILTMDALCSSLTRQMPLLSNFGGTPSVSEDASDYYLEAATRAIAAVEDEVDLDAPVSLALQLFDNNSQALAALIANMLSKRDQWQTYTADLTHFDRHIVDHDAKEAVQILVEEKLQVVANVLTPNIQFLLMPLVRYAVSNLDTSHPLNALQDWQTPLTPTFNEAPLWQALAQLLLTNSGTYRKSLRVSEGFPSGNVSTPLKNAFYEVIATLEASDAQGYRRVAEISALPNHQDLIENQRVIHALNQLLMLANGHLWTIFQAAGEVDFIAIAERAQRALGNDEHITDLALALDYRISHLLIDEFQDTSPVQLALVERLTAGWQANDGRTIFCVGDPMQSIYRFRKAEVSIFLEVSAYGIGGLPLTKLTLSRNNRSQPAVIDWINQTFSQVFPSQDHIDHGAISYRPFFANKTTVLNEGVTVHALVLENAANDGSHMNNTQSELIDDAAQDTQDDDDAHYAYDTNGIEAQHVASLIDAAKKQSDSQTIAVLVRGRKHLTHLALQMKRQYAHIPFQALEIEALKDKQSVQDVISLTKALHHLADRVHWLNVLRAPWCGLTLNDMVIIAGKNHHATIWQLMQQAHLDASLSDDGQLRLKHAIHIFENAFKHQGKMPVRRWLESVWLQLGGAQCLIEKGDMRDVNTVFDLVEKASLRGYLDLAQLDAGIEKLFAEPNLAANDKVQFLTIHRSKGLEFDVVIVPGLNRKTRAEDQPLVLWQEVKAAKKHYLLAAVKQKKAPIYALLKGLEKKRSDFETMRLLYVAATRAVRELHLVASIEKTQTGELNPNANAFLSVLWPVVEHTFTSREPLAFTPTASVGFAEFVPTLQRLPISALALPAILQHANTLQDTDGLRYENSAALPMNQLVSFTLDIHRHLGILAHRYMELMANAISTNGVIWTESQLEQCLPAMQYWLMQLGFAQDIAKNGAITVRNALKTTMLSSAGQWVLSAHEAALSELSLTQQLSATTCKTHVIDRTFIVDNCRWIIDYKLAYLSANDDVQIAANLHTAQLKRYADLFKDEGLVIKTAVLFLSSGQLMEVNV